MPHTATTQHMPATKHTQRFIGSFQPSTSRLPGKPPVDYARGGDDFRTFQPSCLGKQYTSDRITPGSVPITKASRFEKSESVGPGPVALVPYTSMKKQTMSNRRTASNVHFGTSTRDSALKMYAVYTCKK